jgi:DNA polymerase III subunit delta'
LARQLHRWPPTRHEAEIVVLDERVAAAGERGSGRKQLEERHRREQRRHRTDELRSGLGVMAGALRDAMVAGHPRPDSIVEGVGRIIDALEALERNPNETLLLQRLLLQIPPLPAR